MLLINETQINSTKNGRGTITTEHDNTCKNLHIIYESLYRKTRVNLLALDLIYIICISSGYSGDWKCEMDGALRV